MSELFDACIQVQPIYEKFLASEAMRQISILESGGTVRAETRGFDEHKAETYFLRSKEDAPDYRYMPDPNLPPLLLDDVCSGICCMTLILTLV